MRGVGGANASAIDATLWTGAASAASPSPSHDDAVDDTQGGKHAANTTQIFLGFKNKSVNRAPLTTAWNPPLSLAVAACWMEADVRSTMTSSLQAEWGAENHATRA